MKLTKSVSQNRRQLSNGRAHQGKRERAGKGKVLLEEERFHCQSQSQVS